MLLITIRPIFVLMLALDNYQGSAIKWVGPNEKIMCNCVNDQCLDNGHCEGGVKCKDGYFGYACQYSDASINVLENITELIDNNDETCIENNTIDNVTIEIFPSRIRFIQLVYKEKADMQEVTIKFIQVNTDLMSCNGYSLNRSSRVLEYRCRNILKVQSVIIIGPGVQDMCSVYVSRGRNMALKSELKMGAMIGKPPDTSDVTNGIISVDNDSCFSFTVLQGMPPAYITFNTPISIDTIVLHTELGIVGYTEFQIECENSEGSVVWRQRILEFHQNSITVFPDHKYSDVHTLLFSFNTTTKLKIFSICELEAFGDCGKGKYGLSCDRECSPQCKDKICTIEGECIQCKTINNTGPQCCSKYCGGNQTCSQDGACTDGCVTGYYGPQCFHACSPFCGDCVDNVTCKQECKPGAIGTYCNKLGLPAVDGTLQCHCTVGKCSNDHNMCPIEQCIKGWFAYSCLYRDAGAYAVMTHPSINDNDDTTCYRSHINNVTAEWDVEYHVSWVRLAFDLDANISNFEIQYNLESKTKLCPSPSVMDVPNRPNVYDLDCFVYEVVKSVTVTWTGHGSLCTFNICEGRNLAQISNLYVKKNNAITVAKTLNDGDVGTNSCFIFDVRDRTMMFIDFKQLVYVDTVRLITIPFGNEVDIEVVLLKRVRVINKRKLYKLNNNKSIHDIFIRSVPLTILEIYFLSGLIHICEVQFIGECSDDTYGLRCEDICRFTCYRNRCTYDGRCFDCILGRSGPQCETLDYYGKRVANESINDLRSRNPRTDRSFFNLFLVFVPVISCLMLLSFLWHKANSFHEIIIQEH